jgi:exonuclease VII small subunit
MEQYHRGFELVRKCHRVVESKPGALEKIRRKENALDLQFIHIDPRAKLKSAKSKTVA